MKAKELNSIRSLMRGSHSNPGVAMSLSLKNAQNKTLMQAAPKRPWEARQEHPRVWLSRPPVYRQTLRLLLCIIEHRSVDELIGA